jgi:hypothetical protein
LAVYALSTIAAGSFHDHSHSAGSSCSHAEHAGEIACLDDHGDHSDACADDHSNGDEDSAQNSEQSSDDACVVCRFLGLSSLPTALPPLPATADLVATIRSVEPRHAALPLALTLHSRAPPQVV